jgi:hypothetical protein
MWMTMTSSAIFSFGRRAGAACSFLVLFAAPAAALDRCAAYGPDFTSVEGTSACVKISGHVHVEIGSRGLGRVGDSGHIDGGYAQSQSGTATAAIRTEETVNGAAGDPADFPYSHHLRLQQDSDPAYSGWYVR